MGVDFFHTEFGGSVGCLGCVIHMNTSIFCGPAMGGVGWTVRGHEGPTGRHVN